MYFVQDEKRPTINDILNDHLVLLNQCRLERSTSPQPDVPSETQHQLEDKLVSIHKQLQAKEKELDSKLLYCLLVHIFSLYFVSFTKLYPCIIVVLLSVDTFNCMKCKFVPYLTGMPIDWSGV